MQDVTASGALVPDELTNELVRDRLAQPDAVDGFLLDGYPRNVAQVAALDEMLAAAGQEIDLAIELTVDPQVVVDRLTRRAQIEGRADDTEDVIRHRLGVYAEQTAPISQVYDARGLLAQVDGLGDVDDVTARLLDALSAART